MEKNKTFKDLKLGDTIYLAVSLDSDPFVGVTTVTKMEYATDFLCSNEKHDVSRILLNDVYVKSNASVHISEKYDVFSHFIYEEDAVEYVQPYILQVIRQKEQAIKKYRDTYQGIIDKLKQRLK